MSANKRSAGKIGTGKQAGSEGIAEPRGGRRRLPVASPVTPLRKKKRGDNPVEATERETAAPNALPGSEAAPAEAMTPAAASVDEGVVSTEAPLPALGDDSTTETADKGERKAAERAARAAEKRRITQEETSRREQERVAICFKALGDPTRLRIIDLLLGQEARTPDIALTVGEVSAGIGGRGDKVSSTLSHHLKELRTAGLITMKRQGKNQMCRIEGASVATLCHHLSCATAGVAPAAAPQADDAGTATVPAPKTRRPIVPAAKETTHDDATVLDAALPDRNAAPARPRRGGRVARPAADSG